MLRLDPDARRTPQHDPLVLSRGCGEMFAAVLTTAYRDLWAPDANVKQERDQAYLLLTQKRGQWSDHRTFLADQCGVNGDKIRDFVWEQLEGVRDPIVRSGTHDEMGLQAGVSVFTQAQIDETRAFHNTLVANLARERTKRTDARQARQAQQRAAREAREEQQKLAREAIKLQEQQPLDLELLPSTRIAALRIEADFYFTGKPCRRKHLDRRRASDGSCLSCERAKRAA